MANLETRLQKLETVQQAQRRTLTDLELAHRLNYIIDRGEALAPPGAWELLEKFGFVQETEHEHA